MILKKIIRFKMARLGYIGEEVDELFLTALEVVACVVQNWRSRNDSRAIIMAPQACKLLPPRCHTRTHPVSQTQRGRYIYTPV
jgi:hypothetical protein